MMYMYLTDEATPTLFLACLPCSSLHGMPIESIPYMCTIIAF